MVFDIYSTGRASRRANIGGWNDSLLSGNVRRTLVLKLERNRQKDEFVSSLSPWTPTHGKRRRRPCKDWITTLKIRYFGRHYYEVHALTKLKWKTNYIKSDSATYAAICVISFNGKHSFVTLVRPQTNFSFHWSDKDKLHVSRMEPVQTAGNIIT